MSISTLSSLISQADKHTRTETELLCIYQIRYGQTTAHMRSVSQIDRICQAIQQHIVSIKRIV